MKKYIFLAFMFMNQLIIAQFFIDFNTGYTMPCLKNFNKIYNIRNHNYQYVDDRINDTTYYISTLTKFNIADGINIKGSLGYKLKHFSFAIDLSYLDNTKFGSYNIHNVLRHDYAMRYLNNDSLSQYSYTLWEQKFFISWFYFSPKISYTINWKKLSLMPFLSVAFDYITIHKEDLFMTFSTIGNEELFNNGCKQGYLLTKSKYKPRITSSPLIGLNFTYRLNKHFSLLFDFSYQRKLYDSSNIKIIQYYSEYYNQFSGETIIDTEIKEMPKEYTDFYLSNYKINFGLRYSFCKKEKTTGE